MKNKIFLSVLFAGLVSLSSCEKDESLDPLPLKLQGQYVKLDVSSDRLNFSDLPNAYFGGTLSVPSNNVVRYELFVRRELGSAPTADYKLLTTVTSFPHELKVTPNDIAAALEVDPSTLQNGDYYRFYAVSYDANGNKAQYRDLSRNIATENTLEQAYRFRTVMTTDMVNVFNIYGGN